MQSPDELEEAQMIPADRAAEDAKLLLRQKKDGFLCTISKRVEGWPFGSIAPYALDATGAPILFISTIAEHTKNIDADDRVSFLVQESEDGGDTQAKGRITVMGRASRVSADDLPSVRARYLSKVPAAVSYSEAHDFAYYRIVPEHVRFIGGFGKIFWLPAEKIRLDPATDPMAKASSGIIEHMNSDHEEAIQLYCRAFKATNPASAKMIAVDQFGFEVECREPNVRLRFDFDQPATPSSIRGAVVDLARRARESLGLPPKEAKK
jgi:putative heme iron utilization protein